MSLFKLYYIILFLLKFFCYNITMKKYDVCVIGGGPSGLMAAYSASLMGAKTILLEKEQRLGNKLRLSGGGRCNVTNNCDRQILIKNIPGNGKFLYSCFNQFDNFDLIDFFNEHSLPLIEEDHGRMFPSTLKATSIIDLFINLLDEQKVEIFFNSEVLKIKDHIITIKDKENIYAKKVILCTGGKSFPTTGSTGDGYLLAKQFNHHITKLYPCEAALIMDNPLTNLQGISLRDITLSVVDEQNHLLISNTNDLLFTHFGLSGPVALRASMFINQLLMKNQKAWVLIDLLPTSTIEDTISYLHKLKKEKPKNNIKNILNQLLNEKIIIHLLNQSNIDYQKQMSNLSNQEINNIANIIHQFKLPIARTMSLDKAFVTGGGIDLKEVNPKTMESKLSHYLYFAGEILDINGYTGGFNITSAMATGYVAGYHSSISCLNEKGND